MSYGAILADPPWSFKTWGGKTVTPHRTKEDHYSVMLRAELQFMPVDILAAPDCALFMWSVDSHLAEAIDLGRAWGFEYKTIAFVWAKTTRLGNHAMGMGYWTRKQAEVCLLFTKGKPRRYSKAVRQLIVAPRREHSRKPDEVYDRIEALVQGPYLELFSRTNREGWSSIGHEAGKFGSCDRSSELTHAL